VTQALATRTCAYAPCSKEFEPEHWRQIFCTPTCRANQHYVDHPEKGRALVDGALRCVAGDALDLVRGDAEESPEKARWTLIVREQIARTLDAEGYFSAEDLDDLDLPAEHVNVCTSQIGSFASQKLMRKRDWKRSEKVSRKGGILWTFQVTEKGREKLPALLEDVRSKLAGLDTPNPEGNAAGHSPRPGAAPSTGHAAVPRGAGSSGSVESGESGSGPVGDERQEDAAGLASAESPVSQAPITGRTASPDLHEGHLPASSPYSAENEYA
jgi:hypothetical protein